MATRGYFVGDLNIKIGVPCEDRRERAQSQMGGIVGSAEEQKGAWGAEEPWLGGWPFTCWLYQGKRSFACSVFSLGDMYCGLWWALFSKPSWLLNAFKLLENWLLRFFFLLQWDQLKGQSRPLSPLLHQVTQFRPCCEFLLQPLSVKGVTLQVPTCPP